VFITVVSVINSFGVGIASFVSLVSDCLTAGGSRISQTLLQAGLFLCLRDNIIFIETFDATVLITTIL
jgi:hypothetical protein